MTLWLVWLGCGTKAVDAKGVAETLCAWGQLDELTPEILPDTVDLTKMVRERDLRFAREEPRRRPSAENPFLAMKQTVGMEAMEPAQALAEAVAAAVKCEVTGSVDGDRAEYHVIRNVPRPLRGQDSVARAAELHALPDRIARKQEIKKWIEAAEVEELDYDIALDHVGSAWVANFGLPEKAVADAEAELATVTADIARMEQDQAQIDKLVIVGTQYFARNPSRANPRVDITVRNDLDMRVAKLMFHGVLTSADRPATDPWVDAELPHTVLGRLEPGDQDTFTIVSRLPAQWRTLAPEGSTLSLKVTKIAGPSGQWKYDVAGWDDAVARRDELGKEIARLRSAYLAEPAVQ